MGQLSPVNIMPSDWLTNYEAPLIEISTYAEIWTSWNDVLRGTGAQTLVAGDLKVVGGTVTIDRGSTTRRTASNITFLVDSTLVAPPTNILMGAADFSPFGHELRLFKGLTVRTPTHAAVAASLLAASAPSLPLTVHGIITGGATATTAPTLPLTITTGVNDTFDWTYYSAGSPLFTDTYTIAPGTYTTLAALAAAMNAANSISHGTFSNVSDNGTTLILSGLDPDQNGSYLAAGPTDALASLGFANPTTITGGVQANDSFLGADGFGYGSNQYQVAHGTYTTLSALATALNEAVNEQPTYSVGGVVSDFIEFSVSGSVLLATVRQPGASGNSASLLTYSGADILAATGFVSGASFTGGVDASSGVLNAYAVAGAAGTPGTSATVVAGVNDTFTLTLASDPTHPHVFTCPPGTYTVYSGWAWWYVFTTFAKDSGGNDVLQYLRLAAEVPYPGYPQVTLLEGYATENGSTLAGNMLSELGFTSPATLSGGVAPGTVVVTYEYAQLGCYLIEEVDVKEDASGITLVGTMSDRSANLKRLGMTAPWTTNSTHTADNICVDVICGAINQYFGTTWSALPFTSSFTPTIYTPAQMTFAVQDDPWAYACQVASDAGYQLYFDYSGTLVLEPIPDPTSITPCVSYIEGTSTAVTTLDRKIANRDVPNIICVTSQGSGVATPVKVYWWDSNNSRWTYFADPPAGGFGTLLSPNPQTTLPPANSAAEYPPNLKHYDTSLAVNEYAAQAIANSLGYLAIGAIEQSTFTIRDQPAHDIDDVVTIQRVRAGILATSAYIIDRVQVDLGPSNPLSFEGRLTAAVPLG